MISKFEVFESEFFLFSFVDVEGNFILNEGLIVRLHVCLLLLTNLMIYNGIMMGIKIEQIRFGNGVESETILREHWVK